MYSLHAPGTTPCVAVVELETFALQDECTDAVLIRDFFVHMVSVCVCVCVCVCIDVFPFGFFGSIEVCRILAR